MWTCVSSSCKVFCSRRAARSRNWIYFAYGDGSKSKEGRLWHVNFQQGVQAFLLSDYSKPEGTTLNPKPKSHCPVVTLLLALKPISKKEVCWSLPEPYTTQLVRYICTHHRRLCHTHSASFCRVLYNIVRSNSVAVSLGHVVGKLQRRRLSSHQIPFKLQREAHQGCFQQNASGVFTAKDWRSPAYAGVCFETGADFVLDPVPH